MTNEEYIKSLDTEKLAYFLKCITVDGIDDFKKGDDHWTYTPTWEEWLKEKHIG